MYARGDKTIGCYVTIKYSQLTIREVAQCSNMKELRLDLGVLVQTGHENLVSLSMQSYLLRTMPIRACQLTTLSDSMVKRL